MGNSRISATLGAIVASTILAACAHSAPAENQPAPAMAANPGTVDKMKLPPGYLPRTAMPDSLALLPPPPAPDSAAMKRDEEARDAAVKLRGTARYTQAATDAVIGFPQIPNDFSCAMGIAITPDTTPKLYAMMAKMTIDVGLSTYGAKNKYMRVRPFVAHNGATCYAKDEQLLRKDGSYPSGHSALGWGWALVLGEVNPERANAIYQRGREFGQSRLICDAHWQSDIDAGRVIGSAAVSRLHADPAFLADLQAAKAEVEAAKAKGSTPTVDCAAEAAALATVAQ
ncbi:acid phosphatase (class A) [Sphingomonas laterariae]|uniref:Acid phosphatase n=1 Tax=Edaphosphingomonas laterariae TaxID=861865 RepID=A0A239BZ71_9SPHN|nr:phosphatase PAP2 family protein [Sphingomonas laterariae]SNS12731.1 acid phosphatase (class A) [Sphingomonas laterariae]